VSTSNSSKNALSHGVYSSKIALDWENEQDFKVLHEELREDFFPNGRAEEEVVYDLACQYWKKRRLNIGFQLPFFRARDANALADAGRRDGWQGIAEYFKETLDNNESARDAVRSTNKAVREMAVAVHGAITKRMEQMLVPGGTDQESRQNTAAELEKLTVLMGEMKAAVGVVGGTVRAMESWCLDENPFERAYRPDLMEKELKLLAEVDKRIDKAVQRLAVLKDFKKLYQPKEVKVLPALPANGEARELSGSPELSPSNDHRANDVVCEVANDSLASPRGGPPTDAPDIL
jgi:hypothetical protein